MAEPEITPEEPIRIGAAWREPAPSPRPLLPSERRAAMNDRNQDRSTPHQERQQNQEGQNQSVRQPGEGGQPGQDNDLAGMEGQEPGRGGQQGQPARRSDSEGEHGGNR
jgi:hypothetical protein